MAWFGLHKKKVTPKVTPWRVTFDNNEIVTYLNSNVHVYEKNYKNQLAHLLDEFNDKYPLDDRYYNILDKIFYKLDECGVVNEKET